MTSLSQEPVLTVFLHTSLHPPHSNPSRSPSPQATSAAPRVSSRRHFFACCLCPPSPCPFQAGLSSSPASSGCFNSPSSASVASSTEVGCLAFKQALAGLCFQAVPIMPRSLTGAPFDPSGVSSRRFYVFSPRRFHAALTSLRLSSAFPRWRSLSLGFYSTFSLKSGWSLGGYRCVSSIATS